MQVVKEERGNKGAALTTYLSLAGRYSVLMPNTARGGGISRKITNTLRPQPAEVDRRGARSSRGHGRHPAHRRRLAHQGGGEARLRISAAHVGDRARTTLASSAPTLVYEEGSLIKRAIRDLYNKDVEEIIVAGEEGYPRSQGIHAPADAEPRQATCSPIATCSRFSRKAGVEAQLDAMFSNQVTLKSGGYIVINQTEALVAIDVNSGRSTREHNIEDTALRTNLEAADEIARQLRLRDLAGLIVVDFIDMEEVAQQSRGRAAHQGRAEKRPRPHSGRPHFAFRPAGNVAPAHSHRRARRLDGGLPALHGRRRRALDRFDRAACAARSRRRADQELDARYDRAHAHAQSRSTF